MNTPAYDRVTHEDLMSKADRLISELGEALTAAGTPASGKLAAGHVGCAQVCFMDAERCFGRGKFVSAASRANKGLRYLS
jgi:hypothetical protein